MVFRKPGRPGFYCWPTLPGIGRVGPWSTGASSKRLAESVDAWLRQVAMTEPEIVRGIVAKRYSLREAYVAHLEGRLGALKENMSDPPLTEAARRYEGTLSDRRLLNGVAQLLELAPKGVRLSWLNSRNITDLLVLARSKGRKTNSVHRSLYAAIKGLLAYELGNAQKRAITADVKFTYEDDTRHVSVSPEQIAALLGACDPEMYDLAVAAMLTGVDLSPLLRLTPGSFDFDRQLAHISDTKNVARRRTIELSETATAHFRRLAANARNADAPIFRLTERQATFRWIAARRSVGMDVRFKDLRHVFATAWVDDGGALHDLGGVLGHSKASTTLKYTARQVQEQRQRMERVAERLGLQHQHVKVERA
jgi:integrase